MIYPDKYNDEEVLLSSMRKYIDEMSKDCTLYICAGHFLLVYDQVAKAYVSGIFEDSENNELKKKLESSIGIFPTYTWNLGCQLVNYAKSKDKMAKLVLLINDWQYVGADPNRELSEPNSFRANFYKRFTNLPIAYQDSLKENGLTLKDDLFWCNDDEFYFREVRLRDRFARKIKYLEKQGVLVDHHCQYQKKHELYFSHPELQGPMRITSKQGAGCAGEIAQMIFEINNQKSKSAVDANVHVVNFLPLQCQPEVNNGTVLCYELFDINPNVLNVYFEGNAIQSKENFYNSDTGVPYFKYLGRAF